MPKFVQILAAIFLGLPGGIMFLVGIATSITTLVGATGENFRFGPDRAVIGLIGATACLMGYLMMAMANYLVGESRYRLPRNRLAARLGLEFAELCLVAVSAALLLSAVVTFAAEQHARCAVLALAATVSSITLFFVVRRRRALVRAWQTEMPEAALGDRPHEN